MRINQEEEIKDTIQQVAVAWSSDWGFVDIFFY